jgi:transposase-like protein
VFVLVDRGTEHRYVVPAKSADESTIRPLLTDRHQEPFTVYTDGFCAYDPLDEDEKFDREHVVHGDGEYADDTVHVNTCELKRSPHTVSPSVPTQTRTLPQTRTRSAQTRCQSHSLKSTVCYTRAVTKDTVPDAVRAERRFRAA